MKINFLKPGSTYYPFRWLIIITTVLITWLGYADYTGWRILSFDNNQQWNASGAGYHK